MSNLDLAARLDAVVAQTLDDLTELIAIPSVSSMPEHAADVERGAAWLVDKLKEIGAADAEIVREGGQPAVIAHFPAPAGQPTVCLYAHQDVQPIGDESAWTSPAFRPEERAGRLYGRGSADDKGGVVAHLAALRAWDGRPPVGVTLFIEGEEECGSPSMGAIIERHREALRADAYLILDSGNWEVGQPALTSTLRGVTDCVVEVSTLAHGVHSGEYGGVVPDALMALCRLLATLHDDAGNVAVAGLTSSVAPDLDYPVERLEEETGKLPGVAWIGDGSFVQRIWNSPAISVLAIDTTSVAQASNTLLPSARAKVSLRVPPGLDARVARDRLAEHLRTHAPWGAHVEVTAGEAGQPGELRVEGPMAEAMAGALHDAWGVDAVSMGMGGSIPMVADFQRAYPDATVMCTAVADPLCRMHGLDESLDLGDWRNAALAEALFFERVAR